MKTLYRDTNSVSAASLNKLEYRRNIPLEKKQHEDSIDHRSFTHNLSNCEIKAFISYIYTYPLPSTGILRTHNVISSVPAGLIAQLAKHCTVSQRSWAQIPFRPEFVSGFYFTTAWSNMPSYLSPQFKYMRNDISYILLPRIKQSYLYLSLRKRVK